MVERVFLGWDRPMLGLAVAWLLQHREHLPGMLVVVPTSQSGRRLREALAEAAGALLAPEVTTPGALLDTSGAGVAPDWIERLAWVETLESIGDWENYGELFSARPGEGKEWAGGLSAEFHQLRLALQENGRTLASAARILGETVEARRWEDMARLEESVERTLAGWGYRSRSRLLAGGGGISPRIPWIVLAGVAEIPPLLEKTLADWKGKITSLVGAPASEAESFSPTGLPMESWAGRIMPWPAGDAGSVILAADPRQQASEALRVVAEHGLSSDRIAVGAADPEVAAELAAGFSREGWPAFFPAAVNGTTGLRRWLRTWISWLDEPKLAVAADLLALPETGILVGGRRAQKADLLAKARDRWMTIRPDDLRRRAAEREAKETAELLAGIEPLENWRTSLLGPEFPRALSALLEILGKTTSEARDTASAMSSWLAEASELIHRTRKSPRFWIELMISEIPVDPPVPPVGRVIDVQGWLELFHEPGEHLILCGMNEGIVPAPAGGGPWLSEASRKMLGLTTDARRAARDAYLYMAMLEARRFGGRVDVICGKSGTGGESRLPSRFLLAAEPEDLPGRVMELFREIEPPEASLRWQAEWHWKPSAAEGSRRISVTSLRDWLACPFRYYLKHVVAMSSPDANRAEWNPRDFGVVCHQVLERWGKDEEARAFQKTEAIHEWLSNELDQVVTEWFGKNIPLAVRIQTEALRQRLNWLARVQGCAAAEGWEVIEIERKIEIPAGEHTIVAKIDRIDRNKRDGRLRLLDYKTGRVESVARSHRRKITAASPPPHHLVPGCPAIFEATEKGKTENFLWQNLQLPLYVAAAPVAGGGLAVPAYFTLGLTEKGSSILEWTEFSDEDAASAMACARWIVDQISERVFWPPSERVDYDDYAILSSGRPLEEVVCPPP